MPRKGFRPEEIIAKLREADVLLGQGKKVGEVVKALGVGEVTCYRWRQEYGGMTVPQARRPKELGRENARLRKAVADLTLDKLIPQEAGRGDESAPSVAGPRSSRLWRRSGSPRGGRAGPWASPDRCNATRPSRAPARRR
jgi:putative transposase